MFLFKIIKRLFQFALLLVIIIPLYVAGNQSQSMMPFRAANVSF